MIIRWMTGIAFGAVALVSAWLGSYAWLAFLGILLWMASTEWRQLGEIDDGFVDCSVVLSGLLFVWVGVSGQFHVLAFLPLLLMFPVVRMIGRQEPERSRDLVWTAGAMVWLSLPAALLYLVRFQFGFEIFLVLLGATIIQDTMALYTGMLFGGDRPFSPGLSPNKTWAGFSGGLLGALVVFVGTGMYFSWPLHFTISLGLLLGVVGQVGDLSISGLKRRVDMDDTGSFFPGHGGILDRVDGLIFNVAVFYPYCHLMESYL